MGFLDPFRLYNSDVWNMVLEREREHTTLSIDGIIQFLSSSKDDSKMEMVTKRVVPLVKELEHTLKQNCKRTEELAGKFLANPPEDLNKIMEVWKKKGEQKRPRDFREESTTIVAWYLAIHFHAYHRNSEEKPQYRISGKSLLMVTRCLAVAAAKIAGAATGMPILDIVEIIFGFGGQLSTYVGSSAPSTVTNMPRDKKLALLEDTIAEAASRQSSQKMKVWLLNVHAEFQAKAKLLAYALGEHSARPKVSSFFERFGPLKRAWYPLLLGGGKTKEKSRRQGRAKIWIWKRGHN